MSLSGREYLHHILDEADYLSERSQGLISEAFQNDETFITRRRFKPGGASA